MLENHSEIRAQFPFLEKITYLDSAHYTPFPLRSVNKLNEFITKFTTDHINLSLFNLNQSKALRELRKAAELQL